MGAVFGFVSLKLCSIELCLHFCTLSWAFFSSTRGHSHIRYKAPAVCQQMRSLSVKLSSYLLLPLIHLQPEINDVFGRGNMYIRLWLMALAWVCTMKGLTADWIVLCRCSLQPHPPKGLFSSKLSYKWFMKRLGWEMWEMERRRNGVELEREG